ncbi:hypothetical protein JYQ62_05820 [Nostoc sp. UHCC 0702]|nr:hypothetical protein JYQ62_05820 [Nostoc sp. UHCC 0702]
MREMRGMRGMRVKILPPIPNTSAYLDFARHKSLSTIPNSQFPIPNSQFPIPNSPKNGMD